MGLKGEGEDLQGGRQEGEGAEKMDGEWAKYLNFNKQELYRRMRNFKFLE